MTWIQLLTWGIALLLIVLLGYIILNYLTSWWVSSTIATRLTGDGTSTASVQLDDLPPLVDVPEDPEFESGYVSDDND
jgi:hypothetical protein